MFSFRGKEEPALQLYGKLPLAKDYLRIGCGDGAGRKLREWMDRGFSTAVEETGAPGLPGPLGFLWSDGSGTALLGILWPSSDAGGLRPFPFALFVERRWRALWGELAESLAQPERWLDEIEACRSGLGGFADGAALLSGLRGKRVTPALAPAPSPAAPGFPHEAWIARLWPEQGQAGLEAQLGDVVRNASEPRPGTLQLPLADGLPLAPQIHAWWSVLVETGLAAKKGGLALFFPRTGSASSRLTLFPRTPEAGPVGALTQSSGDTPSGAGPDRGATGRAAPIDPGPTLATTLCGTLARVRARLPVSR